MQKIVSLFTFILLVCGLSAQITITQNAMPVTGDTLRYSTASPADIGKGWMKKGGSQSWDFSTLKSNGSALYEYLSANKTPYAFYFFGQIGQKTADSIGAGPFLFKDIYSFYTKSSTVFKTEGLGYQYSGFPLAAKYTDDDEIYSFPLEYNDSDVSTFRFVFSIPGQTAISFIQGGKRTNVVDAWGSIKTPYKTYTDVLRVKTIVDEVDTIVSPLGKTPIPRKQVLYKFLATTERIPVLEVVGTENASGVFTPTVINYRDKYQSTGGNTNFLTANFAVDKTKGEVRKDTFYFDNLTVPFSTSYQWEITPSTGVTYVNNTDNTSQTPSVVFNNAGTYSVKLTSSAGRFSDDTTMNDLIFVGWGLGLDSKRENTSFLAYPSPVENNLYFRSTLQTLVPLEYPELLSVYDVLGKKVMIKAQKDLQGNVLYYSVDKLVPGVYWAQFGDLFSVRFLKN